MGERLCGQRRRPAEGGRLIGIKERASEDMRVGEGQRIKGEEEGRGRDD